MRGTVLGVVAAAVVGGTRADLAADEALVQKYVVEFGNLTFREVSAVVLVVLVMDDWLMVCADGCARFCNSGSLC
jgi:hypothetical protein